MITTVKTFNAWKNANICGGNNLSLYVENVTDLYLTFEWLQNACIKKYKKFGGLDLELLVNSSTMKQITRNARKYAARYDERYTMQDDLQARRRLARVIFETCEYVCK